MPQKRLLSTFFKKFFLLILFISIAFLFFFTLSYFKIKKIVILNNKNKFFITGLKSIENQLIFFANEQIISDFLLKNNPQIENLIVKKKLPDTIILNLQFAKASAQLKTNGGYLLLSKIGKIIKKTKTMVNQIPLINFYQLLDFYQFQSGNYLDFKEILIALEVLEKLKNLGFNDINTIDIKSFDVIIFNKDNEEEIIINTVKDKEKLFYEIETIINKNKVYKKRIKKIDLRFSKPIILLYE